MGIIFHMFEHILEDFDPKASGARLATEGFVILPTPIAEASRHEMIDFIDSVPANKCEINYGGTEKRIWDAHTKSPLIEAFREFSNDLLERLYMRRPDAHTVLAYSNKPIPDDRELASGRWHLDSLRKQVKVFAFLTKTTEKSGPLEILRGTHRSMFKVAEIARGTLLNASLFTTGKRLYQKLPDDQIDRIIASGKNAVPILCEAGAIVIVNTSAIHRARPCFEQGRYALTSYYDHF